MRVVDRHDQRRVLGEHSNRTEDAERHRSALQPSGLRSGSAAQQRNLEGLALGVREPPERSVRHVAEEITERSERQRDLGLDRPAREHLQSPRTGVGDALPPERRLPDPGLTLDEQRDRSPGNRLQEVVNRIDLRLAPHDLQRRRHQPSLRQPDQIVFRLLSEAGGQRRAGRRSHSEGVGLGRGRRRSAHRGQMCTHEVVRPGSPRAPSPALRDAGEPLRAEPGVGQRWTPMIDAIYVPDIDASLDEQGAKRGGSARSATGTRPSRRTDRGAAGA